MAIFFVKPKIVSGHRMWVVYDRAGQPLTTETTRLAALTYISEGTPTDADIVITTLAGIFTVDHARSDATPADQEAGL